MRIAHRPGHGGYIQRALAYGHPADGFMRGVVHHHMQEIRGLALPQDGHRAQVHQRSAVAIQAPDAAVGLFQRNAQGNHAGMSHAAHREEVPFMPLSGGFPQLEQLPAQLAGGGYEYIPVPGRLQDLRRRLLPG